MSNKNPFPESSAKAYLRRLHLKTFLDFKKQSDTNLNYLGLPSAEMLDVKAWKNAIGHVTAIERDIDIARQIASTAVTLAIRHNTTILLGDLTETLHLMSALRSQDKLVVTIPDSLSPTDRKNLEEASKRFHHLINLDLCGGFLYPTVTKTSRNLDALEHLITLQKSFANPFFVIITFNLRDTGAEDYDTFIKNVLNMFSDQGVNVSQLSDFYLKNGSVSDQPQNLRRLRFCVPTYIHKVAYDNFFVRLLGSWTYKTFYHAIFRFDPRVKGTILGNWPPIRETQQLINSDLYRLNTDESGTIISELLSAPILE